MSDERSFFSLVGKISLDGIKEINSGIRSAENSVKQFTRELGKMGTSLSKAGASLTKNITAPLSAVTAAIGVLTLKTSDYASKLLSLSEATGLTTNSLQEYEHIARTAGVSSDGLLNTTLKLSNRLDEISKGTGSAAEAMDKLGISVTNSDGSLRGMEELFPQILGELNKIENATERNNIAQSIFGANIKDLAPVLSLSAEELANLRNEAHNTGKVIGGDALVNADKFRASVANMKSEFGVLFMQLSIDTIPIIQGTLIPIIREQLLPIVLSVTDKLRGLADWFNKLSPAMKSTVVVIGALIAALGPTLMLTGQLILAFKSMTMTAATLTGVMKGLWAVMIANPIGLVTTAMAVFAGTVLYSKKKLEELDKQIMDIQAMSDRQKAHQDQHAILKKIIEDYEKLRGTDKFDPAEYERLTKALEDNAIALTNCWRAYNKQSQLDELGEENRRRTIKGLKELTREEWERHKNTTAITDRQRKLNEEAAEKEKKLSEERRQQTEKRKAELASLVLSHKDAIDKIVLDDIALLDKEEEVEIAKAKTLKASEEELSAIRVHFHLRREKLEEEATNKQIDEIDKQIEAHKKELEEIEKVEAEKLKTSEETNKKWEVKLLNQIVDSAKSVVDSEKASLQDRKEQLEWWAETRYKILDEEYSRELEAAYKNGADTSKVTEYYENEKVKLANEINKNIIELDKKLLNERISIFNTWSSIINDSLSKLGSVFNKFYSNENKRLDKHYKEQREYIENNIVDEEERKERLEALKEEEEEKKLEIQRKQAAREKAFGVFSTIIDTSRAIVKTLADLGPIAGPIMAGVIGALGIAQTAAIVQTPEPFYDGGLIKGSRDGIVAQIGENNQDEIVLPLERGTEQIADKLTDSLQSTHNIHLHVGTLIADDKGIKELVRKITPIMINEDRRTGRA